MEHKKYRKTNIYRAHNNLNSLLLICLNFLSKFARITIRKSQNMKLSKIKINLNANYSRDDITYSIGVAYGNKNENIYGIIKRADIALYKSKETKNCITLFNEILQ